MVFFVPLFVFRKLLFDDYGGTGYKYIFVNEVWKGMFIFIEDLLLHLSSYQ